MTVTVEIDTSIGIEEKVKNIVEDPGKYKVIFMNDNSTPMDFVVSVLCEIFKHSEKTAQELTMKIHNDGSTVVGLYTFEIAEQRSLEATKLARTNGFPLQIAIEKE
ncbi:MAG: ATP-dependent Clp protease adaptor ClpS [Flavobacteriaceae bacterium]|nr:ATP-dependent Clp protease adaptor ClpS [Flavobacteriaceae bacterium]|tara:strand:+ start:468 stop:785 length:318 start_codon:yes stop_codon:yes gene_type:complete